MVNPNFPAFASAINFRIEKQIKDQELFLSTVTQEEIWDAYLNAFPEGSNPVFRERTSHDCNCCKQFIRSFGRTVTIKNGVKDSIWNVGNLPEPYATVAKALHELVVSKEVHHIWRTKERQYGSEKTRSMSVLYGLEVWNHFWGHVNATHHTRDVGTQIGGAVSSVGVFKRGMEELTLEAGKDVLDLINSNNLLRGEEFKKGIEGFIKLKKSYDLVEDKNAFLWENWKQLGARIRNTAIGSLLIDLSNGVLLNQAVGSYEVKVGGANYKRPKALITPRMVEMAQKELADSGLEGAIHRRFAKISDISVNNVLFVDAVDRKLMQGGLMDLLGDQVKVAEPKLGEPEKISADEFLRTVLPKSSKLSAMIRNSNQRNLVSLTAPQDPEQKLGLFKWDNDFAWSYEGNYADSVKERVKAAGGNINAAFRVSLSWFNKDDLDIHLIEPNGTEIYYVKRFSHQTGGTLDVDMNISAGNARRDAVENIAYKKIPPDGVYTVVVDNYNRREQIDVGCSIQVEFEGQIQNFHLDKAIGRGHEFLSISIKGSKLEAIRVLDKRITCAESSREIVGIVTGKQIGRAHV